MKSKDVEIGAVYSAKVSGKQVELRIISKESKGWLAENLSTGREIHVRGPQRLRRRLHIETGKIIAPELARAASEFLDSH